MLVSIVDSLYSMRWTLTVLLLLTTIYVADGDITIMQTRVSVDSESTWPVMGVASLEFNAGVVSYLFDCNAGEVTSMTRLTWERVEHTRNPFEVARLSTGSSRLIVGGEELVQENLGLYRCWHRDTGESTTLLLTSESPAIIFDEGTVAAELNQTLNLSVHISSYLGPLSDNQVLVTWYLPSGRALNSSDPSVDRHLTGSRLLLAGVTADSVGEYTCTVQQNRAGSLRTSSISMDLTLFIPAAIVGHPSSVTVLEGSNATLTCTATGFPAPVITWKRAGSPSSDITQGLNVLIQQTIINQKGADRVSSTLILVEASSREAGAYYCVVQNSLNELYKMVESAPVNVTVTADPAEPPVVKVTYNNVSSTSHSLFLVSGDRTRPTFRCSASGHPSPSVSWTVTPSLSAPANVRYTYVLTQRELALVWEQPLEPSDSGLYECVASNVWGESRASVNLTVIYKPVIDSIIPAEEIHFLAPTEESGTAVEVPVGFTGTLLTCSGYAWPVPTVRWAPLDTLDLPCGMSSKTRTYRDGVVTASLAMESPFNGSCVGRAKCEVALHVPGWGTEDITHTVDLDEEEEGELRRVTQFQLTLKTNQVQCSKWTEKERLLLGRDLSRVLSRSVVQSLNKNRECVNISTLTCDTDRITVSGSAMLDCQSDNPHKLETTTLYLFLMWKNSGPLVSLNGTFWQVDPEFALCPTDSECGLSQSQPRDTYHLMEVSIVLYTTSGAVFLLLFVVCLVFLSRRLRKPCSCCNTSRRRKERAENHYV